jgi:hypothetical protein
MYPGRLGQFRQFFFGGWRQLSLTREEWIEYFRSKKLPPTAEKELAKLTQPTRVHENRTKLRQTYAPLVTKL